MPPEGDNTIAVKTDRLRKSADLFDLWSKNLLTKIGELKGLTITPGTFPAATDLQKVVAERVTTLVSNVEGLGNACKVIAENLRTSATDYDKSEDDKANESKRLKDITLAVNNQLKPKK